jgi:glycosyltransferase involved in cell wall biosynthesis
MAQRLALGPKKMAVLPNGINLTGYRVNEADGRTTAHPPVLGYFARMCPEKGLDTLVDAYLLLKKRPTTQALRLHVGGGCGPGDQAFVDAQRRKLESAGCLQDVAFFPNVSHSEKISFLQGLTLFSVPSRYNEAFGLYLIEAMAAGAAVVQPQWAAYPEVIQTTGGGVLYEPNNSVALAEALESLLQDPARSRKLAATGQNTVFREFSAERMASNFLQILQRPS